MTRGRLLAVGVALGIAQATSACRNGTGPDAVFPALEFRAPIQAMFPGMQDTVMAYRFGRRVELGQGAWTSTDRSVIEVEPGGVVRAVGLGEAFVALALADTADSLRIAVVTPPEGQIAFGGFREFGDPQSLWVMNADGTGLRELWRTSGGSSGAGNPSFSPDGCSLVFQDQPPTQSSPALRRLSLSVATGPVIVPGGAGPPAWSPDGQRILFSGLAPGGFQLFSVRPDGTDLVQHTNLEGQGSAMAADYFPDSGSVVFERDVPGSSDLYRLDLTSGDVAPLVTRDSLLYERFPAVSPDGSLIAFFGNTAPGRSFSVVHIVGPDSVVRLLTPPSRTVVWEGHPQGAAANATGPSFSPDGDWLALSWDRDARFLRLERDEKGANFVVTNTLGEIYVMRTDGTEPVRLTHFAVAFNPDWGPECTGSP